MAAVVTTVSSTGDLTTFDSTRLGDQAIGFITFLNSATVAMKDALDEMTVTVNLTLPPNFAYRFSQMTVEAHGSDLATFTDVEPSWMCQVTEDRGQGNVTGQRWSLYNESIAQSGDGFKAYKGNADAVTQDFTAAFSPIYGLPSELILANGIGNRIITMRILDSSADDTPIWTFTIRVILWQYTIEQARGQQLHTPQLITW